MIDKHRISPDSAATLVLIVLAAVTLGVPILAFIFFFGIVLVDVQSLRRNIAVNPPKHSCTNNVKGKTCRIRVVNTAMLPFPFRVQNKKTVERALNAGVFDGVDVVLMQEVFRTQVLTDSAHVWQEAANARGIPAHVVVPEVQVDRGRYTDSGLAMAGMHPWLPRVIAFLPFDVESPCLTRFAKKGVAIFETQTVPPLRIATTHMQSTPIRAFSSRDDNIRFLQFQTVANVAKAHNADILAGDINTDNDELLKAMDAYIFFIFGPSSRRILSSIPDPTCCKTTLNFGVPIREQMRDKLDHIWLLSKKNIVGACEVHVINHVVTNGWTDHSALDFTVTIAS